MSENFQFKLIIQLIRINNNNNNNRNRVIFWYFLTHFHSPTQLCHFMS